MLTPRCLAAPGLAVLSVLLAAPVAAQAPTDFKGETVTVQIGYGPGGGYTDYHDVYVELADLFLCTRVLALTALEAAL